MTLTLSAQSGQTQFWKFSKFKIHKTSNVHRIVTRQDFTSGEGSGRTLRTQEENFPKKQHLLLKNNTCCYIGHMYAILHEKLAHFIMPTLGAPTNMVLWLWLG